MRIQISRKVKYDSLFNVDTVRSHRDKTCSLVKRRQPGSTGAAAFPAPPDPYFLLKGEYLSSNTYILLELRDLGENKSRIHF